MKTYNKNLLVIVKFKRFEGKKKGYLIAETKLQEVKLLITHYRTKKERKSQVKLNDIAEKEKTKGHEVLIG